MRRRTLGLGISNKTLANQIADDPTFKGPTGTFDRSTFNQILQQAGFTEAQYIAELRANYIRQQIANGLAGGTKVPDAYMQALHEYQSETRKISYVIVTAAMAGDPGEPTDTTSTPISRPTRPTGRRPNTARSASCRWRQKTSPSRPT